LVPGRHFGIGAGPAFRHSSTRIAPKSLEMALCQLTARIEKSGHPRMSQVTDGEATQNSRSGRDLPRNTAR
jgi:hypothetical protein